jgi:hypothetical protein
MLCALAPRYMGPLCQVSRPKVGSHREEAEYASREGLGPIRSGSTPNVSLGSIASDQASRRNVRKAPDRVDPAGRADRRDGPTAAAARTMVGPVGTGRKRTLNNCPRAHRAGGSISSRPLFDDPRRSLRTLG